jgi:UDP-N-acetylmuramoyl-tripeptide--D-alanyl-D-alanine ligase
MDLPNKILWMGGMKEMGSEERTEHLELVALIAKYNWKEVILVGKEFKGINNGYTWFDNSTDAANYIREHMPVDSSILIKGSRGSKMEVMVERLNL